MAASISKTHLSKSHCATGAASQCSHTREQLVSNRVLQHPLAKEMCPDMGDSSMASEHQSRTVVAIILRLSVSRISHSLLYCLYSWCWQGHNKTYEHMHRAESNGLRGVAEKPWNPSAHRTVSLRDLPDCPRQHTQNCKAGVQTHPEEKQKPLSLHVTEHQRRTTVTIKQRNTTGRV